MHSSNNWLQLAYQVEDNCFCLFISCVRALAQSSGPGATGFFTTCSIYNCLPNSQREDIIFRAAHTIGFAVPFWVLFVHLLCIQFKSQTCKKKQKRFILFSLSQDLWLEENVEEEKQERNL